MNTQERKMASRPGFTRRIQIQTIFLAFVILVGLVALVFLLTGTSPLDYFNEYNNRLDLSIGFAIEMVGAFTAFLVIDFLYKSSEDRIVERLRATEQEKAAIEASLLEYEQALERTTREIRDYEEKVRALKSTVAELETSLAAAERPVTYTSISQHDLREISQSVSKLVDALPKSPEQEFAELAETLKTFLRDSPYRKRSLADFRIIR